MSWFWSSGGSVLTQIKKNAGHKITQDTPTSPVKHRRSTEFLTITKTCSFSNFNLQDKILVCFAWFTTIPGTLDMFSQVPLDI